jgi:hypothetical protein
MFQLTLKKLFHHVRFINFSLCQSIRDILTTRKGACSP